jgi:hypothetical protein
MTIRIKLPGDKRPRTYRAFIYGRFAHVYDYGQPIATITPEQAEAGRIAHEDEIARCRKDGD